MSCRSENRSLRCAEEAVVHVDRRPCHRGGVAQHDTLRLFEAVRRLEVVQAPELLVGDAGFSAHGRVDVHSERAADARRDEDLDALFAALGEPPRRRVVDLLRERPRRAGELAEACGTKPPAMSRHLRVLRERGVVEEERGDRDARVRVFRLRRAPFAALRAWLEQVEGFWQDQPGAFEAHAERQRGRGR